MYVANTPPRADPKPTNRSIASAPAAAVAAKKPEPSSMTRDELRRIVLDLIG